MTSVMRCNVENFLGPDHSHHELFHRQSWKIAHDAVAHLEAYNVSRNGLLASRTASFTLGSR